MVGTLQSNQIISAAQGTNRGTTSGTNSNNLYIDINKQGAGTLTGSNVDQELVNAKVERLLSFEENMSREVNPASESTLFSAGQIQASWVDIKILRTQTSMYVQNQFLSATNIPSIIVYRVDVIAGKYTITEKIDYKDCIFTKISTSVETLNNENLSALDISFRFNQRQDTLFFFDQEGKPIGQNVSLINFPQGTLQAPPAGSGGGDSGGGGGLPT